MENKCTSFGIEDERSTFTDGESKSRRSSILKPPKARAPLQEVNLGGSADDTEDFDTLRKRRVSFAGVNSVKEFCSNAESLQVCHIQSYEETFSTSSDNSQNSSAAKGLQIVTPARTVPVGEDMNFADDPMDLTDSIVDNNIAISKSVSASSVAPKIVQVQPFSSANVESLNSDLKSVADVQFQNLRKPIDSMVDGQSSKCNIMTSNMSISFLAGGPISGMIPNDGSGSAVRNREVQSSCSMEITEPLEAIRNRISSVNALPSRPLHSARKSIKIQDSSYSDSGMEITEAVPVRIRPFSLNQPNDNFCDTSMEMTEVIKKGEMKTLTEFSSFNNKSASMEFTQVIKVDRRSIQPQVQQVNLVNFEKSGGMELTEPIGHNEMGSWPSQHHPLLQNINRGCDQASFPETGPPQGDTPFPCVKIRSDEVANSNKESIMHNSGNVSTSDMEMTGVLSLSKYDRLVSNDDEGDDMDFTQLLPIQCDKKPRLSNEPQEEQYRIISPLSAALAPSLENHNQIDVSRKFNPEDHIEGNVVEKGTKLYVPNSAKVRTTGPNHFEEDDDTFALNFKSVKKVCSPVEVSFLKEFRESPVPAPPVHKTQDEHKFTSKYIKPGTADYEHLLLYSPPEFKDEKPSNPAHEDKISNDEKPRGSDSQLYPPYQQKHLNEGNQPSFIRQLDTQNRRSSGNPFGSSMIKDDSVAPESEEIEKLRNMRSSNTFFENDSSIPKMRISFKDLEIKVDNIAVNDSLLAAGLDHSDILKDGYDNLTCPEQVPSVCISMTSKLASPTFNSMLSVEDVPDMKGAEENAINTEQLESPLKNRSTDHESGKKNPGINRQSNFYEQDTSVSVPIVFKPMPDKSISEINKFRQSFPVLSFDESPNVKDEAQMDFTGVLPSMGRKSIRCILPDSCSSGQMELTNLPPISRKSLNSTQILPTSMIKCESLQVDHPNLPTGRCFQQIDGHMGLSMDETHLKQAIPKKSSSLTGKESFNMEMDETLFEVKPKCDLNSTRFAEHIDHSCEMGESDDTQKDLDYTNLVDEVNIAKQHGKCSTDSGSTNDVIETDETPKKFTFLPDNVIDEGDNCTLSHSFPSSKMEMNLTAAGQENRVSSVHSNRKSLIGCQTSSVACTIEEAVQGNAFHQEEDTSRAGGISYNEQYPSEFEMPDQAAVFRPHISETIDVKASRLSLRKSAMDMPLSAFNDINTVNYNVGTRKSSCFLSRRDEDDEERSNLLLGCQAIDMVNADVDKVVEATRKSCSNTFVGNVQAGHIPSRKSSSKNSYSGWPHDENLNTDRIVIGTERESTESSAWSTTARKSSKANEENYADCGPSGGRSSRKSEFREHSEEPYPLQNEVNATNMTSVSHIVTSNDENDDPLQSGKLDNRRSSVGGLAEHGGIGELKMTRSSVSHFSAPDEGIAAEIPVRRRLSRNSNFFSHGDINDGSDDDDKSGITTEQGHLVASNVAATNLHSKATEEISSRISCADVPLAQSKLDDNEGVASTCRKSVSHLRDPDEEMAAFPSGRRPSRKSHFNTNDDINNGPDDDVEPSIAMKQELPVGNDGVGATDCQGVDRVLDGNHLDVLPPRRLSSRKSCVGVPFEPSELHSEESMASGNWKSVRYLRDPDEEISAFPSGRRKSHFYTNDDINNEPGDDNKSGIRMNLELPVANVTASNQQSTGHLIKSDEETLGVESSGRLLNRKSCVVAPRDPLDDLNGDQANSTRENEEPESIGTGCSNNRSLGFLKIPNDENTEVPLSRRKSCVGVQLEPSTNLVAKESNLESGSSEEFEFFIKRKSSIGIRSNAATINQVPQQEIEVESGAKETLRTDEVQEIVRDVDLSTEMMNISLIDGDINDFEGDEMHCTSTPCKSQPSYCSETDKPVTDRKRNFRSNVPKSSEPFSDLAHDLSQELMNVSIQSDTRSPLPKKMSTGASHIPIPVKLNSIEKPLSGGYGVSTNKGSNLHDVQKRIEIIEDVKNQVKANISKDDLPYEVRVKNRDIMGSYGFFLLGTQTVWESMLLDNVMGIKLILPLCEFSERTQIVSLRYTFYPKRVGLTCLIHKDVIEFFKNRMMLNLPEVWLKEECSTIKDLNRIIPSIKGEIETLRPLIDQLNFIALRYPCKIFNSSISFCIANLDLMIKFDVEVELKSSHQMRDGSVVVKNVIGKLDKDMVQMVFRSLPRSVELYYAFATYLKKNTSKFVVR